MHNTSRISALGFALFLGCAALGGIATDAVVATEVRAAVFDTTYFYAALAPDGRWYYHPRLGWVWYPIRVEASWQPYTRGRWEWADEYGWVWASDESFGWATYHYGRWYDDPHTGWVWVPGDVWGPAWVSWRVTDSHVGWAPLPPQTFGHEISLTLDFGGGFYHRPSFFDTYASFHIAEPSYNQFVFVDYNNFNTTHIDKVVIRDNSRRERFFREARDVTRYDVQGGHARFRGDFGRQEFERRSGRQIRPVRITEADRPTRGGLAAGGDGALQIYRPRIERAPKERAQRITPDRLGLAEAPDEQTPPQELKQRRQRGDMKTAAEERKDRGLRPLTADNPKELETEAQTGEQRLREKRSKGSPDAATDREGRQRGGEAGAETEPRGGAAGAETEMDRQRRERGVEAGADAERRGGAAGAETEKDRQRRGGEAGAETERRGGAVGAETDMDRQRRERGGDAGATEIERRGGTEIDRQQRGRDRDGKGASPVRDSGEMQRGNQPTERTAPGVKGSQMERPDRPDRLPGGERPDRAREMREPSPAPAASPERGGRGDAGMQQREQRGAPPSAREPQMQREQRGAPPAAREPQRGPGVNQGRGEGAEPVRMQPDRGRQGASEPLRKGNERGDNRPGQPQQKGKGAGDDDNAPGRKRGPDAPGPGQP